MSRGQVGVSVSFSAAAPRLPVAWTSSSTFAVLLLLSDSNLKHERLDWMMMGDLLSIYQSAVETKPPYWKEDDSNLCVAIQGACQFALVAAIAGRKCSTHARSWRNRRESRGRSRQFYLH